MTDFTRPLRVFLCHASGDKPAVGKLYTRLVEDGVDAWLDREKLIPGQNWQVEIPRAVKNSDVVVVCLSSQAITKEGYVQKEIRFALDVAEEKPEGTIFIIPARLENCEVPERINKFQWVDLFSDDGYDWLLKALQIRAESVGTIEPLKKSRLSPIQAPSETMFQEQHPKQRNHSEKIIHPIESESFYFSDEYRKSFKGRYFRLHEKRGTLRLTVDSFMFTSGSFKLHIDHKSIKSIALLTSSRMVTPIRLAYISVTYFDNTKETTVGLLPTEVTSQKTAWGRNRVNIQKWIESIEKIPNLSQKIKGPLNVPSQAENKRDLFIAIIGYILIVTIVGGLIPWLILYFSGAL